jgi:toxin ParE1/3/4
LSEPERYDVEISEAAIRDIDGIVTYLVAQNAVDVANNLIAEFRDRIEKLAQFPRRGGVPKEVELQRVGEVRQLVMPPYRLVYQIVEHRVIVTMFADGRRDMRTLLAQRIFGAGET